MNFKKRFLTAITILVSMTVFSQEKIGYYINWNQDHTERTVKPTIKLNDVEAKTINCCKLSFTKDNRLKTVAYYV